MIANNNELSLKNKAKLSYKSEKNLLYQIINNENCFCISQKLVHKILKLMHNFIHYNFDKFLQNLIRLFIYKKINLFKQFINHCLQCKLNYSRWHQSYDFLQSILFSSISFHMIILDFIISLLKEIYDVILIIINKFIKKKILIFRLFTWDAENWATVLLNKLIINDWNIFRIMILNRDIKFLLKLWKMIFKKQKTQFFYFITYHSQTDDAIKRINQEIKIVLRYFFSYMNNSNDWHKLLTTIQEEMNAIILLIMKISSHEFIYELKLLTFLNLVMKFSQIAIYSIRLNAYETIMYAAIKMKKMYDKNYKLIFFKLKDKIIFRLHKKYIIILVKILKFKFCQ